MNTTNNSIPRDMENSTVYTKDSCPSLADKFKSGGTEGIESVAPACRLPGTAPHGSNECNMGNTRSILSETLFGEHNSDDKRRENVAAYIAALSQLKEGLRDDEIEIPSDIVIPKEVMEYLKLEPRCRVRRALSFESTWSGPTSDNALWTPILPKKDKSLVNEKVPEKGTQHAGSDTTLQFQQPADWSSHEKEMMQQLCDMIAKVDDSKETKQQIKTTIYFMKRKRNTADIKTLVDLIFEHKVKFPSSSDFQTFLILVEELAPGLQKSKRYMDKFLSFEPKEPATADKAEDKTAKIMRHYTSKGGNSGHKFDKWRLNTMIDNAISRLQREISLPPENDGSRKDKEASQPKETPNEPDSTGAENFDNFDTFLDKYNSEAKLPRMMKFKDEFGNVVIATLDECLEDPVSDHTVKKQSACYRLEAFWRDARGVLIPWHDLIKNFPERPMVMNAAWLVDIAGRKWAGRLDIEQKRSLVSCGFEAAYRMPMIDKLNVSREYFIRVLDVVLGDRTAGKVYTPEAIVTVTSTFKSLDNVPMGKVFVRKGYEKTIRAYSLLNLFVPHYIFAINEEELLKARDKRLSNHFNYENYKKFYKAIMEVVARFKFAPSSLADVQPEDFVIFAKEMVDRKMLTQGQGVPFYAAADYARYLLEEDGSGRRLLSLLAYCCEHATQVFIKNEEYDKDGTTLRFIVSPHVFVKVVFGTVFRRVEELLYFDDRSPLSKHLIKGLTAEQVKSRMVNIEIPPDCICAETDISAFEGSQTKETLSIEYDVYKSFYNPDSLAARIISCVEEINCKDGYMYNKYFKILRHAMRLSGLNPTACGNAFWNYVNLVAACLVNGDDEFLIEGDDGYLVVKRSLISTMESNSLFPLKLLVAEKWNQLSFCGHHYDDDGFRVIEREELLRKVCTYFSDNPISRRKAYELLYMRLLSFQLSYPGNPYLDEIIDEVNREYAHERSRGVREKTVKQWYRDNWWRFDGLIKDVKLPDDRTKVPNFHQLYRETILKANQRGDVISPQLHVDLANYCIKQKYNSNASSFGNAVLRCMASFNKWRRSKFCKVNDASPENCLVRRGGQLDVLLDSNNCSINEHDHLIDYLNQSAWFRKLSRFTGWSIFQYSNVKSLGSDLGYEGVELEHYRYARAYNFEWKKLEILENKLNKVARCGLGGRISERTPLLDHPRGEVIDINGDPLDSSRY